MFNLLTVATKNKQHDVVEYLLEQTTNVAFSERLPLNPVGSGREIYQLYFAKNPSILTHSWQGMGSAVCIALTIYDVELLTYLLESRGGDPWQIL